MQQQRSVGQTKVLCVGDDVYLCDLLRYVLTREGYWVELARAGAAALRRAEQEAPDVVIMDVNLPDVSWFDLCARFHRIHRVPVIMLMARQGDDDVVVEFEQRADDHITKPFSMQVLVHRLRAVLRCTAGVNAPNSMTKEVYRLGIGTFHAEHTQIIAGGASVKLTVTEGKILRLLLTHEGQVFSAERIIESIRDYDSGTTVSVVKTHVRHLRTKIATALGDLQFIHTVPGMGYTLRQPTGVGQGEAAG